MIKKVVLIKEKKPSYKLCSINKDNIYNNNISTNFKKQLSVLDSLMYNDISMNNEIESCMKRDIQNKISGYKGQDIKKNMYNSEIFINIETVYKLLSESDLKCCYCEKSLSILYNKRKQMNQWTLDRVDNYTGHNIDNCVIACLKCNLQRRRLDSDKFKFTKQMKLSKLS